ncbi:GP46-like surface antigen, putative, partial [Bodo saltans]
MPLLPLLRNKGTCFLDDSNVLMMCRISVAVYVWLLLCTAVILLLQMPLVAHCACECAWRKPLMLRFYDAVGGSTSNLGWDLDHPDAPCGWDGLSCMNGDINALFLKDKSLRGTLPSFLSELGNLTDLDLRKNSLEGTLPTNVSSWANTLKFLALGETLITGTLPESWTSLKAIDTIVLSLMPGVSGTLPSSYSIWGSKLTGFLAERCSLTGPIPVSWAAWTNVEQFAVGGNV